MAIRKSRDPTRKNKPWYCTYRDQHKKQHRYYFRLEREAKEYDRKVSGEIEAGTHTPVHGSITVAEACKLWLAHCELERRLDPGTLVGYRDYVRHIVSHQIGKAKLPQLKPGMVGAFVADVTRAVSQKTARRVLYALRDILKVAQEREQVAQNVAMTVRVPTINKRDEPKVGITLKIPTPQEAARLIVGARPTVRPMVMTALFTGMRWGELRALTWDDIDFERRVITVRKAKTGAGVREIPMSLELTRELRKWRLICPRAGGLKLCTYEAKALQIEQLIRAGRTQREICKELHVQHSAVVAVRRLMRHGTLERDTPRSMKTDPGNNVRGRYMTQAKRALVATQLGSVNPTGRLHYVFPTRDGRKQSDANTQLMFRELQQNIGMVDESGKWKFGRHRTRHWFASCSIHQGWPAKRLQVVMGHASITETFNTYGHMFPDAEGDRARLERSDAAFRELAAVVTKLGSLVTQSS